MSKVYIVTGASSGLGLEATRQLMNLDTTRRVYMLCRSKAKAQACITQELGNNDNNKLVFLPFDACNLDDIPTNVNLLQDNHIDGVLLNAGGFGSDEKLANGATVQAASNLLGHVVLIEHLLTTGKIGKGTRIVASGSEGALCIPAPRRDYAKADLLAHLTGHATKHFDAADEYGWTKGISALYWSAFARRHANDVWIMTLSPGATKQTHLFDRMSCGQKFITNICLYFFGHHSVEHGAKRYVDALVPLQEYYQARSGSFYVSKKGYSGNEVQEVSKLGYGVFNEEAHQDRAWEAVNSLLSIK